VSKFINKGIVKGAGQMKMKNRLNYFKVAPKAMEKIMDLESYVKKTSIDKKMQELIKIRVSQINGCSYCLNMHTKAAKKLKVKDELIDQLPDWNESDLYSAEEKIVFELAENMTRIMESGVSDSLYQRVREHYDEKEYVNLIIINQINMWNRLSIAMGNTAE